jgi:putative ABC transport system permease protein
MTIPTLILRTAVYYWRTNLAVMLGVGAAASVLGGALVVGESVRGSLRDIAVGRLGSTDTIVSSIGFFRESLADDVRKVAGSSAAPMIVATGFVTDEQSRRRASDVLVYGVDERFWSFNRQPIADGVYVSPALATELGLDAGHVLLARLQKPSDIPVESLFGRKDDVGRTVRLQLTGVLPRERLGEFALQPQQSEVRAVFAPLRRIQRDLAISRQANTVLISGSSASAGAVKPALRLEDLGVRVTTLTRPGENSTIIVESGTGIVSEPLERAARQAGTAVGLQAIPVFTYLANSITNGDRTIPYSLITATALDALTASTVGEPPKTAAPGADAVVLNTWAARELGATIGDPVDVEYYLWDHAAGLQTKRERFVVSAIVPISGLAADRRLAPEYPGITAADSLADWDPPFPIDLSRVRPIDEEYWRTYRTTPKAFIRYERGRDLWRSRYGALTSIRFAVGSTGDAATTADAISRHVRGSLSEAAMGVTIVPVRSQALAASSGATDFGEYFTYFSFFIVVSALMLVVLFFRLGIEQRLREIGVLRSAGYGISTIRRLLLGEAVVLALAGGLLGVGGAVLYASAIVHGLRTWWIGAVGTTLLTVHVSWIPIAAGMAGGVVAAVVCVVVSLRTIARLSPRALLSVQAIDVGTVPEPARARRSARWAVLFAVMGAALVTLGFVSRSAQAGAFFGAAGAWLVAFLFAFSAWLRARDRRLVSGQGFWAVSRLGFRSAAFRPARSVLSAALIAAAAFIIVSIDAFRRDAGDVTSDPHSGTGGFVLLARAELPLVHDPDDPAGRDALLIQDDQLSRARFTRFRLRAGQDASCLNLYRPNNPTIIAPEPGFIEANRFSFSASMASTDEERGNPWLLLRRRFDDGAVPVIADATSLQYALHAAVGDSFSIDVGAERPLILRFVAALQDSVLQGEIVMAEEPFTRLFPGQQGYQFFLIDDPDVQSAADAAMLAGVVERALDDVGIDAVSTAERLASFHAVENTYLSTFQALGGLGLLLGTVGLAAVMFRNVLERRRELALLRAVGYGRRSISTMIMAEAMLLLGAGLAAGVAGATLAVAPAWMGRGGSRPGLALAWLLVSVAAAGVVSSFIATRAALSGRMLESLRAE